MSRSELPADAADLGLRSLDGRQLWAAADASALYEVRGDTVRVFVPASDDELSCA